MELMSGIDEDGRMGENRQMIKIYECKSMYVFKWMDRKEQDKMHSTNKGATHIALLHVTKNPRACSGKCAITAVATE